MSSSWDSTYNEPVPGRVWPMARNKEVTPAVKQQLLLYAVGTRNILWRRQQFDLCRIRQYSAAMIGSPIMFRFSSANCKTRKISRILGPLTWILQNCTICYWLVSMHVRLASDDIWRLYIRLLPKTLEQIENWKVPILSWFLLLFLFWAILKSNCASTL